MEDQVAMHYPKPTPLSSIIGDVAQWSETSFVMEPMLDRNIQIFAPRKLPKEEAYQLFVTSLEAAGLRVIRYSASTVAKIVPLSLGAVAV